MSLLTGMAGSMAVFAAITMSPSWAGARERVGLGLRRASGTITAVDDARGTVTIMQEGWTSLERAMSFAVSDETDLAEGDTRLTLRELRPGQRIDVTYAVRAGASPMAHAIAIRPMERERMSRKRTVPEA
ncbi:MAG TPA: hypothetical protein VGB20_04360 [bacterium]